MKLLSTYMTFTLLDIVWLNTSGLNIKGSLKLNTINHFIPALVGLKIKQQQLHRIKSFKE